MAAARLQKLNKLNSNMMALQQGLRSTLGVSNADAEAPQPDAPFAHS